MNIDTSDLKSVLAAALSLVTGYVARMFSSEQKIKQDLSYIKGQLSQVVSMVGDVDKLKVDHVILLKDHEKTRRDVDQAHEKIRALEDDVNGLAT